MKRKNILQKDRNASRSSKLQSRNNALTRLASASVVALVVRALSLPISTWAGPLEELEPGPIAITSATAPALFGFDKASGKAALGSEAAGNAVSAFLKTPHIGNPQIEAAVGVVEFAASPFVAGYAALKGSHGQLPPERLSEAEGELSEAMKAMAEQEGFRKAVTEAAQAATHRALVSLAPDQKPPVAERRFAGVIETSLRELRLRRLRNSDKSFRLVIKARVRVIRASDGTIVFDEPFEYQSGEDLFVDWTREDGFASVARTWYQTLAKEAADRIFSVPIQEPIMLGAAAAAERYSNAFSRFEQKPKAPGRYSSLGPRTALIRVADFHGLEQHSLEIAPDFSDQALQIKGLAETQAPAAGTESDTKYALDGLENHPNFVVQVAACFGAIPMGLWEHTVGAFRAGSEEARQAADVILWSNARTLPPEKILAERLATNLRGRTPEFVRYSMGVRKINNTQPGMTADSRVEVRVTDLSLAGERGRNPRLSLCIGARATLVRSCDGQELCSWPVVYRSSARRLKAWAADDRLALREGLRHAYELIGSSMADELISHGVVPSGNALPSTIAAN